MASIIHMGASDDAAARVHSLCKVACVLHAGVEVVLSESFQAKAYAMRSG